MTKIQELCDQIIQDSSRVGHNLADALAPGLSVREIQSITSSFPFQLPKAVVELYMWRNGVTPGAGIGQDFLPGYAMAPLGEMWQHYQELRSMSDYPRFCHDQNEWFPIFRSGGVEYYAIQCVPSTVADAKIIDDDSESEPFVAFESLEAMLETILECYGTGVYYLNQRGLLEVGEIEYDDNGRLLSVDLSRFRAIARKHNPSVMHWK